MDCYFKQSRALDEIQCKFPYGNYVKHNQSRHAKYELLCLANPLRLWDDLYVLGINMLFSDTHWNKPFSSQSVLITWKVVCENSHNVSLVVKDLVCVFKTLPFLVHNCLWASHIMYCIQMQLVALRQITWISSWSSSKDVVTTVNSYLQMLVDF